MIDVNLGDWTPAATTDWSDFFTFADQVPVVPTGEPPTADVPAEALTEPDDLGYLTDDEIALMQAPDQVVTVDGLNASSDYVTTEVVPPTFEMTFTTSSTDLSVI